MDKPKAIQQLGQEQEDALINVGQRFMSFTVITGKQTLGEAAKTTSKMCSMLTIVDMKVCKIDFMRLSAMPIGDMMRECLEILNATNFDDGKFIDPSYKPKFALEVPSAT